MTNNLTGAAGRIVQTVNTNEKVLQICSFERSAPISFKSLLNKESKSYNIRLNTTSHHPQEGFQLGPAFHLMSFRGRAPIRRNNSSSSSEILLNSSDNDILLNNSFKMFIMQTEVNMARDMVLEYSGGSKNLAYFIFLKTKVEYYFSLLKQPKENCIYILLLEQIKSKLVVNARNVLITSK